LCSAVEVVSSSSTSSSSTFICQHIPPNKSFETVCNTVHTAGYQENAVSPVKAGGLYQAAETNYKL